MLAALVYLAALSALVFAAPAANVAGDPPFTVDEATLAGAIDCPSGLGAANTVLLVPGTGEPDIEFFSPNFGELLPANGFPVCFLSIPSLSLGDAQVTSEFVVFASNLLASTTGAPIRVLSHSQGGLNIQWALTFFPSTRKSIGQFFGIAPDFRGTTLAAEGIALSMEIRGDGTAPASEFQQANGSNFVNALASHGGLKAFVPTTTILSTVDDVVQPETGSGASSALSGAVVIPVQSICSNRTDDHFELVTDVITQFFSLQAFTNGGHANPSALSQADINALCADDLPIFTSVGAEITFTDAELTSAITVGVTGSTPGSEVTSEPPLMAYAQ